jgi:putative heme iron utilization protein
MEIILKPQEESTNSKFNGQLVATRNFINTFGNKAYLVALKSVLLIKKERVPSGADYHKYANIMVKPSGLSMILTILTA